MSSKPISIFFTGATGYIGGAVLQRLLARPDAQNFSITTLVRDADKAKSLETGFGVKAVVGSLHDLEILSTLVENAHIVIQTALSDEVDVIQAILKGMKKRHDKTGDVPILIHTSGIGSFLEDARGEYTSPTIHSDLDLAAFDALPATAFHRPVDSLVAAADAAGYARTHIVMPSLVYGVSAGPLVDAGIARAHGASVPTHARIAVARGRVGVLGTGATRWANVHVDDNADLYMRMLDALLSTPEKVSHGREGYFVAENGELHIRDILAGVGAALVELGRLDSAEPTPYAQEELAKYFGSEFVAYLHYSDCRCKAERARRELGWSPRYTNEDLIAGIRPELEMLLGKAHE